MRQPTPAHFNGDALWGDDFDEEEIQQWFTDEENAYLDLYASKPDYEYEYHSMNTLLGYSRLPRALSIRRVHGLGSAYGDELLPLEGRVSEAVIVESADAYRETHSLPFAVEWRKAVPAGNLPLETAEVDLVVCLGVLHHVPNVSYVLREIGRVTEPGGFALIREPIVSMGDWRGPRLGLTARERGIPRELLIHFCQLAGFEIVHETLCSFPLSRIVAPKLRGNGQGERMLVRLDAVLARASRANYRYHAVSRLQKLRPTSTFLVLRKRPII